MRTRWIAVMVLLAALAAAGVAPASPALKDPSRLALRKSDFPSGATIASRVGPTGSAAARVYVVEFKYRTAGKPNELSNVVTAAKNVSLARVAFREARNEIATLAKKVQLPKYGDEQHATFHLLDGARLIVRKNTVVRFLEWQTMIGDREMTRPEVIAEMKHYGAILMRRVGSG